MPGLSERLLAARKSSDMSLGTSLKRLIRTPLAISYELLTRIADLLSLELDINFSKTSADHDFTENERKSATLCAALFHLKWIA